MKISFRPIAAAISLALVSVSAHAAFGPPAQGAAVPSATGLFLEVYNSTSGATELVNLSYAYADITGANLSNLNTPSAVYAANVANPAGAGLVDQLNFGTIANASAFASNSEYMVASAALASQSGITNFQGLAITSAPGSNPSGLTAGGVNTTVGNVQEEIANWGSQTGATGTFFDATGSTTASGAGGPLSSSGDWGNSDLASTALNTATAFYNILANGNRSGTTDGIAAGKTGTTTYAGFWDLTTSGQLTYNIAVAPVPLPAAVWLFGSGLLGLLGVGRRRAV